MSRKVYCAQASFARNAYRAGNELVLCFNCSLPDVCVGCGSPACGNVETKEFERIEFWILPSPFDIIWLLLRAWLGTTYVFAFPFCPNCAPEHFQLRRVRLDRELAVFTGAPKRLLDSLPALPPDVEAEKNSSWLRRKFRWMSG